MKWFYGVLVALVAVAGYPVAKAHFDCVTGAGDATRQVIHGDEKAVGRVCADSMTYSEMVRRATK